LTIVVPPFSVIEAIESGNGTITRRIEIFESDGVTPWYPASDETTIERLIDGGVSVDATRPERRTLDLTLKNDDNLLRPNPNSGFWYDKIIACYRGIKYAVSFTSPKITIVEQKATYGSQKMQLALSSLGFTRTFIDLSAANWTDADSDILVSYTEDQASAKVSLLQGQYLSGRGVLTFSTGNTPTQVPLIAAGAASGSVAWGITPVSTDTPFAGGFASGAVPPNAAGYRVSGAAVGATVVAVWATGGGGSTITGIVATNEAGGRWVDLHIPNPDSTSAKQILSTAIQWLSDYQADGEWETQIGEFCIDQLNDQNFPYHIKVSARDYMKRMMQSKLTQDETFVSGTSVSDMIVALARNSGITNQINVPGSTRVLTSDLAYTRGTARADIAIAAANGIGQQLYFDMFGHLTMEPLPDPTLDPTLQTFKTGPDGNLVRLDRSTNDSNLFNHVVVFGSPDGNQLPYFGEAMNTDPSSPTRIARIGDRLADPMEFDTVNSDLEAEDLAFKFLRVSALETYELGWDAICYPHLDANIVTKNIDPKAYDFEPDKYLMDTLNIPLTLGPMSATGKRITIVGDPGNG
jgi:hypothetical protein